MRWNRNGAFPLPVVFGISAFSLLFVGCSSVEVRQIGQSSRPIKIVVGPVILEAAITKSPQIHTFEDDPPPEVDPIVLAQLVDETQVRAQRLLTEHLARQSGFAVVPFDETRRLLADLGAYGKPLNEDQIRALGRETGADFVIAGRILDYGVVRWQYWVTGWAVHATTAMTVLGFATAWNPAAVGAYAAFDITTDFPLWYGGANVFGWVFRPVRIQLDATQLQGCEGLVWSEQELVIKVPGKTLAEYSPEDQKRKEVQLEANLNRAMATMAATAGRKLAKQPCGEDGNPVKIDGSSIWALLDLLY